ncbi:beta-1,4 N-acetylgalactosaminyltransferase 2-like [Glandiceps talaboti]
MFLSSSRVRFKLPAKAVRAIIWISLLLGASIPIVNFLLVVDGGSNVQSNSANTFKRANEVWRKWENGVHNTPEIETTGEELPWCICRRDPHGVNSYLTSKITTRRQRELEEWERREKLKEDPIVVCQAMSPLTYIGGGITIEPLDAIKIPGLSVDKSIEILDENFGKSKYVFTFRAMKGKGSVNLELPDKDPRNKQLEITHDHWGDEVKVFVTSDLELINYFLKHVSYQSLPRDINERDVVEISFLNFTVSVHIHIKKRSRPILFDPGESLHTKVTVITKTYERHEQVNRLVQSINKFYPLLTIIVADDSEFPPKINGSNVKHFKMPPGEGWFAGRNLALSQVRTKYFLWVEDDCEFTTETKLENFIEKFEKSTQNLDIIGGTFLHDKKNNYCKGCRTFQFRHGHPAEGDCLFVTEGSEQVRLSQFRQCDGADVVDNFFMAKTQSVRQVGFDPAFDRVGHWEFFADAFGRLRIVTCTDVSIQRRPAANGKYQKYESIWDSYAQNAHVQFKNNLKCMRLF